MCLCAPKKRTPWWGTPGCEWPSHVGAYEVQQRMNGYDAKFGMRLARSRLRKDKDSPWREYEHRIGGTLA